MKRFLHIVCLDTPFPADYGGAIDMMNRIKSLHKAGIGIHLHYFSYNERGKPNELNQYCESIHVYERESIKDCFSFKTPYIVCSRRNDELAARINQDEYPVLLEGLHCTGLLEHINVSERRVVVRMHNEESIYYRELSRSSRNLLHKAHFYYESCLLKKYNRSLKKDCVYACISESDQALLKNDYNFQQTEFLPAFPSWQEVSGEEGQGSFCLFHGNLSVPENEEAAIWLLSNVFTKARVPFIIAGKKPGSRLQQAASLCQHTCLVADPSEAEMNDLVRKAHINVLPSFNKNQTGIRLKLLHSLFEGRHCLVNDGMVAGTGLADACHIGTGSNAFASIISQLFYQPFTAEELRLREQLLGVTYDNDRNTKRLIQWLW